jgi:hypothetical protein
MDSPTRFANLSCTLQALEIGVVSQAPSSDGAHSRLEYRFWKNGQHIFWQEINQSINSGATQCFTLKIFYSSYSQST